MALMVVLANKCLELTKAVSEFTGRTLRLFQLEVVAQVVEATLDFRLIHRYVSLSKLRDDLLDGERPVLVPQQLVHRVVDGAQGARLLGEIARYLEEPDGHRELFASG